MSRVVEKLFCFCRFFFGVNTCFVCCLHCLRQYSAHPCCMVHYPSVNTIFFSLSSVLHLISNIFHCCPPLPLMPLASMPCLFSSLCLSCGSSVDALSRPTSRWHSCLVQVTLDLAAEMYWRPKGCVTGWDSSQNPQHTIVVGLHHVVKLLLMVWSSILLRWAASAFE